MSKSAVERRNLAEDTASMTDTSAHSHGFLGRLLDRYPLLGPAPKGRLARIAPYVVCLLMAAFVAYYCAYLFTLQDAFQTDAEDLGIMDQALWNTLHGAVLHQTICNIVTDTNCLGDISRFAVHFEPLMLPLALLYLVVPSPKTLYFVQALIVATGALPAYWIASRRLQSALAGIAFAAVYLLYPALDSAVTFDFHAVTLSAAFLMFALYFMLTRNNTGLFIACLLAISTKEEVPLDIAAIGLVIIIFQRRWRTGAVLLGLSLAWVGLALTVFHVASPLGVSPTAGRYSYLGNGLVQIARNVLTHPVSIVRQHVLDPVGVYYIRTLLSGSGYLGLLSPWTLLMAVPVMLLNLLSSDGDMRIGIYQYNAEIVPFLVLAAVEGTALIVAAADGLTRRITPAIERSRLAVPLGRARALVGEVSARGSQVISVASARVLPRRHSPGAAASEPATGREGAIGGPQWLASSRTLLAALVLFAVGISFHEQQTHGNTALSQTVQWPVVTPHDRLASDLIKLIPSNASVCAQDTLVPHVSERRFIYQFPYHDLDSDFVLLDVTASRYPLVGSPDVYFAQVQQVLESGVYHVAAARDGYLLLARNAAGVKMPLDPRALPASFYSFMQVPALQPSAHHVPAQFGASLQFLGYSVQPAGTLHNGTPLTVTTYWRATAPLPAGTMPVVVNERPRGPARSFGSFVATDWLPMSTWQPGQIIAVQLDVILLNGEDLGSQRFTLKVIDGASQAPLVINGSSGTVLSDGTDLLFATLAVH